MKPFDQLTEQGKMRRYHQLAKQALQSYPVTVKKLRCISIRHNIIFRVETNQGTVALKIGYPDIRTQLMVQSEMQWLDDMRSANIAVNASYPLPTVENNLVVSAAQDGIPSERHIVLMTWLKGNLVSTAPTVKKLARIGASLAKLHNFTANYQPTQPFMTFNGYHASEWGGLNYLDDTHPFLSAEEKALFQRAISTSEQAIHDWREKDGLQLIHADLHLKNAMSYRGDVALFDFDDCRWGHPLQDIGVVLAWFSAEEGNHQPLVDAFLDGYAKERTIPYSAHDLTLATIHRRMVALTFVMTYRPLYRRKHSEEMFTWLQDKL